MSLDLGFRVGGLGFGVWALGFRVWVWGLGCGVSGFWVLELRGFGVLSFVFGVSGVGPSSGVRRSLGPPQWTLTRTPTQRLRSC